MQSARWISFVALILVATSSQAVKPIVWHIASAREAEQGEIEGLSIADDGSLSLAPALEDLGETEELFVWTIAEDRRGRIFAGTGNQGRVFVKAGNEAPKLFFDSPEAQIQALAVDGQGNVYAGSAPDGIIYKIDPDGRGDVFCHTGETYVWDLEFDDQGNLFAATGSAGVVVKINREGRIVSKVLDSRDRHVMTLVPDGRNGFYAGTDGNGLVYHIPPEGNPRLLFSAPEQEIHTLALGSDGRLYAGAVAGRRNGSERASASGPNATNGRSPENGDAAEPGGVIYRLDPSGAATRLWQAPYPLVLSIIPYDENRLLVGVGPRGVLYWLTPDGTAQRIADTGESQPATLFRRSNGEVVVGMGNSGKLRRLGRNPAAKGTFTSRVYDANLVAQWGRVDVRSTTPDGATVRVESRTGNTRDPAEGWSAWANLGGTASNMVQSPPGRFVQLRATLSRGEGSPAPRLWAMSTTGQQVNVRPEIAEVTIGPYRSGSVRPSTERSPSEESTSSSDASVSRNPTRPATKRSLYTVRWTAADANGDDMVYRLSYRRVGETAWKLLADDVTRTTFLWDTEGAPEGLTVVRVEASDRPSNPWPVAGNAERVSDPFEIDYAGPVIADLRATMRPDGAIQIAGSARDASGTVRRGAYAIDSGEWLVFFPEDGIFDSPEERLGFVTEALPPGEHTIVVRVEDAMENVGSGALTVIVPNR